MITDIYIFGVTRQTHTGTTRNGMGLARETMGSVMLHVLGCQRLIKNILKKNRMGMGMWNRWA